MARVVAFLRGINLGNRRLTMDELRARVDRLGYADVATFLASGNLIFDRGDRDPAALEAEIEAHLESELGYPVDTFVRGLPDLEPLLAVDGLDDARADGFKPHAIFLKERTDDDVGRAFADLETPDDRFILRGREVVWLRRGGLSNSPISPAALERALGGGTSTMRTLNTVRRIVGKFGR
jgi:uncharacterized protein (DUF1697 family)